MNKVTRWDRFRSTCLLVGFMLSLAFVNICFIIEGERYAIVPYDTFELDDGFVEIPATAQKKKVEVPPPPIKTEAPLIKKQIIDEIKLVDEVLVADKDAEIQDQTPEDIITPSAIVVLSEPAPAAPEIITAPVEEDRIFDIVERMPLFGDCFEANDDYSAQKSCSDQSVMQFLYKNIRYPAVARENDVAGTVVASFVINQDGRVSDLEILRDIGAGCGDEVLRVLNKCPKWKAGKQNGRPVKVKVKVPVKFRLK